MEGTNMATTASISIEGGEGVSVRRLTRLENKTGRELDPDEEDVSSHLPLYSSSYEDDEVFIEMVEERSELITKRIRRTSDVIDSVGDTPPNRVFFPDDMESSYQQPPRTTLSPPDTPMSDRGYFSPSLLNYKPLWSRHSSLEGVSMTPWDQTDESLSLSASVVKKPQWVEADAKSFSATPSQPSSQHSELVKRSTPVIGRMPVGRDSPEYNMTHPQRGTAHIFNHEVFRTEPERRGSHVDVDVLTRTLTRLGFTVVVHNNKELSELLDIIKDIVKQDYTDCDCLLITVLTHGNSNNILFARDYQYQVDMLWQQFTPDACPTLAGKPKIFFIQACRGKKFDSGVSFISYTETDSGCNSYQIPKMADFLIAYSTAEGFYSWRNPETGTWFIQSLCAVLREYHESTDLLRMLTIVSRKVAIDFESYNEFCTEQHGQKQVPSVYSTLIRDVYLRSKDQDHRQ